MDDASLRASVRFAAMACIILPLLPRGPYGPYGAIRPRELWALVLEAARLDAEVITKLAGAKVRFVQVSAA